jgi:hypothetical protein
MIAEATFVLNPNDVAGWTSNGQTWGPRYYVDDSRARVSARDVMEMILIPFVSRLT